MATTGRLNPRDNLFRSAVCVLRGDPTEGGAERAWRSMYGDDSRTQVLLRAATAPAMLSDAGWASIVATSSVADFVSGLAPVSAAAQLFKSSLQIDLSGRTTVSIPSLATTALGSFVADGSPIRVASLILTAPTIEPHAIKIAAVFTRETSEHASIEAIVRNVLSESMALALDAAVFSASAATATTPAGLRNAATVVTPAAASADAMAIDVGKAIDAVAPIAGDKIAIVASPGTAAKLRLRSPTFPYPIYASSALAAGSLMAIALPALVSGVDPTPTIERSTEALIHSEDTTPLQIATGVQGSGVVATPSRSFFQTDTIGVKLIVNVAWALRASAAASVATVAAVNW